MTRKQWRCFHCDEVFIRLACAAVHFGNDGTRTPACQLKSHERHLVEYIRDLEAQLDGYRADDSHVMRSIYTLEADHRRALNRAEEEGYNKGVLDMRSAHSSAGLLPPGHTGTDPDMPAEGYSHSRPQGNTP